MSDYDAKESKVTGHVKWFNTKSGYGFIKKDSDGADVFVHHSSITATNSNSLADGEEVQFDVIEGAKGLEARNVSGPGGGDVVGGKPSFQQNDNRSNMRRGGPRNDFRNQPYSRNGGGGSGGGQPRGRDYNDRQGGDIQFGRYENNDDRRRPPGQSYSSRGYGNSKGYPSYGQRDEGSSRGGGGGGQRYGGRGGGSYSSGGYDNSRNKGYGGGDNYE